MGIYVLAFCIGMIAGLRAMTAPAAISWAAHLGWLHLDNTPLAFFGYSTATYVFSALAIVELITDQLPSTPSRKTPIQFGARIVSGALCGAALGAPSDALLAGALAGAIGAVAGTLGGAEVRSRLAKSFGKDLPAALLEDAVALGGAFLIVSRL
jgi:uncharacterized membrane protein